MDSTPDLPIRAIHVGADAAERLAAFVDAGPVLVVSDERTREASTPIYAALSSRSITEHVYPANGFDGTGALAEDLTAILPDAAWIVGAGSGTVCDLAKYAGHLMRVPVALYGTAASMNGYTSGIAALKVHGLKRTLPCTPAAGVFADPGILAAAPKQMAAAGLADFLSKCSACADWRAAHLLRGETFREDALQFYDGLVDRVIADASMIGQGDSNATAFLMEALLLSGLSMLMAGSSSPASGGEHLISHYIDMKSAINGTPHDLHGAQVGVATVHCLRLWEQVIALDPAQVDAAACANAQLQDADIRARIIDTWGDDISAEVLEQWEEKSRDREGIQSELERFSGQHATLAQAVVQDVLPAATVKSAIAAAGGPTQPDELNASIDDYNAALENARFIRSRFTVLDLTAELLID